jgi:hypothetical protein
MAKDLSNRKWAWVAMLAGTLLAAGAEPMAAGQGSSFISVQASDPLASEPGNNPGAFTLTRAGDTNDALTVPFVLGGTATNGVDYVLTPTSVTLAAGQISTNVLITPVTESNATGYKTVILTLSRATPEHRDKPPFLIGSLNRAVVYIVYNYTNVPPSVSMLAPTNGASYLSRPNIVLAATASDSNGWVTSVQFYAGGTNLGVVSNTLSGPPGRPLTLRETRGRVAPVCPGARDQRFQLIWTDVQAGAYALTAVATDNAGLQTTSAPVAITVSTNLPMPDVRIITPVDGAEFPDEAPINLYAAAGETNGVVDTVEFFANGLSLATATNYLASEPVAPGSCRLPWLPYYFRWTNAPVGSNFVTAVATDNNGTMVTSSPVSITVTTNLYHPRRHY